MTATDTTDTSATLADLISTQFRQRRTWNPLSDTGLDEVAGHLQLDGARSLLDVGCGVGTIACDWAARYDLDSTGIDIAAPCIAAAQRQAQQRGVRADFHQLDGRILPQAWSGRVFDRVLCLGVAGGLGGWRATVALLAGLTAPDGLMAVGDQLPQVADRVAEMADIGLELTGVVRSTVADQDAYYSDQWQAVQAWARAEPDHPAVSEQLAAVRRHQLRYLAGEVPDLTWGVLVLRVPAQLRRYPEGAFGSGEGASHRERR